MDIAIYLQIAVLFLCLWLLLHARRSTRLSERVLAKLNEVYGDDEPAPSADQLSRESASNAAESGFEKTEAQLALAMDGRIVIATGDLSAADLAGREQFNGVYLTAEETPFATTRMEDAGIEAASWISAKIRNNHG